MRKNFYAELSRRLREEGIESSYYAGAVTWAVAGGITNGTGGNQFSPDVVVTRAQAVTFLWRELA